MPRALFNRLKSNLSKQDRAAALYLDYLRAADAGPSDYPFPRLQADELPFAAAERALHSFYHDTAAGRHLFRTTIQRTVLKDQSVPLSEIEGAVNSQTRSVTFRDMRQGTSLDHYVETYRHRVDELATLALAGTIDCAIKAGEKASILRTGWDKSRAWLGNAGGSHKTGALQWLDEQQNNPPRALNGTITDYDVAPAFRDFCAQHSVYVIKPGNFMPLFDAALKAPAGIQLFAENEGRVETNDWCLIIPRDHPLHTATHAALNQPFDMADWFLNPAAFDANGEIVLSGKPSLPSAQP